MPSWTLFALVVVVLQYGVTDLLYGKCGQGRYKFPYWNEWNCKPATIWKKL